MKRLLSGTKVRVIANSGGGSEEKVFLSSLSSPNNDASPFVGSFWASLITSSYCQPSTVLAGKVIIGSLRST